MVQDFTGGKSLLITWDVLHRDAVALAGRLREKGPFAGIVAVARGGLVPVGIIACELDIRLVEAACIASYDDRMRRDGEPQLLRPLMAGDGAGWLVVDDLVDTGRTFGFLRSRLPRAHFATIYAKPEGAASVDTTLVAVAQDLWLVFPWDQSPDPAP